MITLNINGKTQHVDDHDMPLLWAIREVAGLTGTKFGCGRGLCGACTIHIDGVATRSCVTPSKAAIGKAIVTIESLARSPEHQMLIEAWNEHSVPQCGYCQSGQIMAAAAFLKNTPTPTKEQIRLGVNVLCRCGTYSEICSAIATAAQAATL